MATLAATNVITTLLLYVLLYIYITKGGGEIKNDETREEKELSP